MNCPHCQYADPRPGARCKACGRARKGERSLQTPFVGRAHELALLEGLLEEVRCNATPRIIGLVGRERVGRSRLFDELQRRHDNELSAWTCLRGYAAPSGRSQDPFAPFGRVFHNMLGLDDALGKVEASARFEAALAALNPPSLGDARQAARALLGMRHDGQSMPATQIHAQAAWMLAARARQGPLMVLVEDFHTVGADGRALLAHLHRSLERASVLILVVVDQGHFEEDRDFFARYGDGLLPISALSQSEVGELLQRLLDRPSPPPDNLAKVVWQATAGLPEAVEQAAAVLMAEGLTPPGRIGWGVDPNVPVKLTFPLTREEAARRRLGRLSPRTRALLRRGALVGETFWMGVLCPLERGLEGPPLGRWPEAPPSEVWATLERAVVDEVLRPVEGSVLPGELAYSFCRGEDRAALLETLSAVERPPLHLRVAQWLEHRDVEGVLFAEIAYHYELGEQPRRAAVFYRQAGAAARSRHALDDAIWAFERARALLDAGEALTLIEVDHALGVLNTQSGRLERARVCFQRMLAQAWAVDHRAKGGAALNRLGRLARDAHQLEEAATLLARGQALFDVAGDASGVAASVDDLGQVAWLRGDLDAAQAHFVEALRLRRALRDERGVALSFTNLARLGRDRGDLDGAEARLREAIEIRERREDTGGVVTSRLTLSGVLEEAGRLDEALVEAHIAQEIAAVLGDQLLGGRVAAQLAWLLAAQGAVDEALGLARWAGELAAQLGDVPAEVRALRAEARALTESAPDRALALLARGVQTAQHHDVISEWGACLRQKASIHLMCSERTPSVAGDEVQAATEALEAALLVLVAPGQRRAVQTQLDDLAAGAHTGDAARMKAVTHCAAHFEPPPGHALAVVAGLKGAGYEAYLVGGCVRDRLLGRAVNDWDIATDAEPEAVQALFPKTIATGIQHGTVTVVEGGEALEVTTYRVEIGYSDGRRPDEVRYTRRLLDDLGRRDFTINAMAWDPLAGVVVDPFSGRDDLKRRRLKAVGIALDRFGEDGLRALRAVRFASVLNFIIETDTLRAIPARLETFRKVSAERVRVEFEKILCSDRPSWGVGVLKDCGLLAAFMPGLAELDEDAFDATLNALVRAPRGLRVRLAILLHGVPGSADRWLRRLKFSNEVRQRVEHLLSLRDVSVEVSRKDAAVRALVARIGRRDLEDLLAYRDATDATQSGGWPRLAARVEAMGVVDGPLMAKELAVSGRDVMQALEMKPSREIGWILAALLRRVWVDPELNTAEALHGILPEVAASVAASAVASS